MECHSNIPDSSHTPMPVIAGILCIIAGSLGLIGMFTPVLSRFVQYFSASFQPPGNMFFVPLGWLGMLIIIIGLLAITGGIFACRRKNWMLSFIGAIASIATPLIFLGIPAIILIVHSKKEFS